MPKLLDYITYLMYRLLDGILALLPPTFSIKVIASLLSLFKYRSSVIESNLHRYSKHHPDHKVSRREVYTFLATQILDISSLQEMDIVISSDDLAYIQSNPDSTRIYLMGHLGRWEVVGRYFTKQASHKTYGAYQAPANPYIDKRVKELRKRSKYHLVNRNIYIKTLLKDIRDKCSSNFMLLADQRPPNTKNLEKHFFLFKEVGCDPTLEKISSKYDVEIHYISQYTEGNKLHLKLQPIHPNKNFWKQYLHYMSQDIQAKPSDYLWSHRRWRN